MRISCANGHEISTPSARSLYQFGRWRFHPHPSPLPQGRGDFASPRVAHTKLIQLPLRAHGRPNWYSILIYQNIALVSIRGVRRGSLTPELRRGCELGSVGVASGLVGRTLAFALLRGAASGLSLLPLDRPEPRVQVQAGLQAFAETPELGAQRVESGIYPIEPGIGPVALPDQHDDCQKDRNYDRRNCRYALYAHNPHCP